MHLSYVRKIHQTLNTILCKYVMCTKYTSSNIPDVTSNSNRKLKIIRKYKSQRQIIPKLWVLYNKLQTIYRKNISTVFHTTKR